MIKKITITIAIGVSIFCFHSCYNDKEELLYGGTTCDGVNASFATAVNPIIQSTCTSADCHGAGSVNGPGPLLTYDQIKNAAIDIKSAVVTRIMPKGSSLSSAQIKTISCWVDSGAPNN